MSAGETLASPNSALGPDVATIVAAAAAGNLESQRYLFQDRFDVMFNPATTNADAMLVAMEAVVFGRLVASHGQACDAHRLAGALCQAALVFRNGNQPALGDSLMAESLSVLEQLAEHGDDVAAMASAALVDVEPVALIDRVRVLRERIARPEENG
jgi:hypothetical protein